MLQPHSQGHRGYFEAFKRRSNLAPDVLQRENILTDRGAYLNFLEVQLEKVSAACLATQDFRGRIDDFDAKTAAVEEKVCTSVSAQEVQVPCIIHVLAAAGLCGFQQSNHGRKSWLLKKHQTQQHSSSSSCPPQWYQRRRGRCAGKRSRHEPSE